MLSDLETERLLLRKFKMSDFDKIAEINASPEVMRYFPAPYSREETIRYLEKIINRYKNGEPAVYACIHKGDNELIGHIGITRQTFEAYFTPCYEIGWRLDERYWNQGYATEGARKALEYGFNSLGLDEIVSYTAVNNAPSIRVMQKIGFKSKDEYFDHTLIPKNHPLARHVLYRLSRQDYQKNIKGKK